MFQLVYTSTETGRFSGRTWFGYSSRAARRMKNAVPTGMLLYHNGSFLRALEGEQAQVRWLADCIATDRGPREIVVLNATSVKLRDFPDWSMGYHNLGDNRYSAIDGDNRFLERPLTAAHSQRIPRSPGSSCSSLRVV